MALTSLMETRRAVHRRPSTRVRVPFKALKGKERKKDGLFFFPLLNIYIRSATENNFIKRGYNERIKEEFFFFIYR